MRIPLPPPDGWDTDLWLMFRGGCVEEGLRDPDDIRHEETEEAAYWKQLEADYYAGLEADAQ